MTDLPTGWCLTTLGEIADVQGGLTKGKKRKPEDKLSEVPYLRVANVQRQYLDLSEVKTVEATASEIRALALQKGDVLFNEGGDRDKLGRGWVWNGEFDVCIHQNHVFRARLSEGIDPTFTSLYGNSHDAREYFFRSGKQTTNLASINKTKLKALPLRIAPLNEQRRIVARIDALQAHSRRAREALDAIPALLERFRQSVLAAAFRGDLTADWRAANPDVEPASELLKRIRAERRERWIASKAETATQRAEARDAKKGRVWDDSTRQKRLATEREKAAKKYVPPAPVDAEAEDLPQLPRGWCWARLSEVSAVVDPNPSHRNPPYVSEGYPFVSTQEFIDGGIELDTPRRVSLATVLEQEQRCLFTSRSILFSRKGTIGKTRLMPEGRRIALLDSLCVVNPVADIDASFMMFALRSDVVAEQVRSKTRGVALRQISVGRVRTLAVPMAPAAETQTIVARLQMAVGRQRELRTIATRTAAGLDTLDQAILAKAFRGELVPQDPNDEPASVLLERIRAEREAQAAKKKTRKKRR